MNSLRFTLMFALLALVASASAIAAHTGTWTDMPTATFCNAATGTFGGRCAWSF